MAKWANYLISGVWKSQGHITHVALHVDSADSVGTGIKTSEADVIKLLNAGYTVNTTTWSYPNWKNGARVTIENHPTRGKILRTVPDAKTTDNLDNLIPMHNMP